MGYTDCGRQWLKRLAAKTFVGILVAAKKSSQLKNFRLIYSSSKRWTSGFRGSDCELCISGALVDC